MSAETVLLGGKVALPVRDLDRALAFYTRVLGFALRARIGSECAELVVPGLVLALVAAPERRFPGAVESHLTLEVSGLEAALAAWLQQGVRLRPVAAGNSPGRAVTLLDPDGNAIVVREAATPGWPPVPGGRAGVAARPVRA